MRPGRPPRIHLNETKRLKMFKRQGGECALCGGSMDIRNLHHLEVDHLDVNAEDYNHDRNLRLVHAECNRKKAAEPLTRTTKRTSRTLLELLG